MEMMERPAGYVGPNLDPTNLVMHPRRLADGVYALMASPVPRDNSGLIVGTKAALLVDSGINGRVAGRLQALAARLTRVPLRYVVNTNDHGDHTFGNAAFPHTVEIVAHRQTAEQMTDLAREKEIRRHNLFEHPDALADVVHWRRPDRVFDEGLEIDLGGCRVELRHVGPGNTPGDTVVDLPHERLAWTGNFVSSERVITMLLEVPPLTYADSLARAKAALSVDRLIPGHGPMAKPVAFTKTLRYLWALYQDVKAAFDAGMSAEAAVDAVALRKAFALPWWLPAPTLRSLVTQFQRLNVLFTYRHLEQEAGAARVPAS